MSHAYGGEGVKICLDAGVDSIEHGAVLDDSLIEQMLKQGTWLVPTFTVLRRIIAIGSQDPSPLPGYMLPKALKLLESQTESFQKVPIRQGLKWQWEPIWVDSDMGKTLVNLHIWLKLD